MWNRILVPQMGKSEKAERLKANFKQHQTISNRIKPKGLTGSHPFVQAQFIASQKRRSQRNLPFD